jgi:hypothetical protein
MANQLVPPIPSTDVYVCVVWHMSGGRGVRCLETTPTRRGIFGAERIDVWLAAAKELYPGSLYSCTKQRLANGQK